jgi:hypothetical protein
VEPEEPKQLLEEMELLELVEQLVQIFVEVLLMAEVEAEAEAGMEEVQIDMLEGVEAAAILTLELLKM